MPKTLYICYFGIREPLVQTQVLPYLREIAKDGIEISLLTFEPDAFDDAETRTELKEKGIIWYRLEYHKRPSAPATLYDVMNGSRFIAKLMRRERFDILHARSHVPMVMAALARKISRHKPKLLFDIRGFFPEEYTDAGIWPENGWLYRSVKRIEKWLMKDADGFVVLTKKAKEILFPKFSAGNRPVEIIPCCVDLYRFSAANGDSRRELRQKLNIEDRFVIAYVGSFGGWYMTEEAADFFATARGRDVSTFALIMTQSDPKMIGPLLRDRGFGDGDYLIIRVSTTEIPEYLSAADAAVSFIKPCYSKQASSPTKNAEYLACGLPVVANDGVGDTTEIIESDRVGVVVREFTPEVYGRALDELDVMMADSKSLKERCRESAGRRFDLETVGGVRYRNIYLQLLNRD